MTVKHRWHFLMNANLLACGLICGWQQLHSAPPRDLGETKTQTVPESLNPLIGEWRGTGQVRRGSTKGAWRQTGEFLWDFSRQQPVVRYVVTDGKLVSEGHLQWHAQKQQFELQLKTPDKQQRNYLGNWSNKQLILETDADRSEIRYRLTITLLNEKRLLVLHEKTAPGGTLYRRIAEVGYTREGTRLAISGGGRRECIVTGGTGTMPVMHKGATYYVCCSGCRQAFEDDPEGILAEFRQRQIERQRKLNGDK